MASSDGIGMATGVIGDIINLIMTEQAIAERKKKDEEAGMALDQIGTPVSQTMTPEQLARPEAADEDPRIAAAQKLALEQMQGYARGDITPADRAQMALAENEAARRGKIQQASILSGAQQRGQLGSGAQLAMQQQAAQGQGESAYELALKNMVNMQNRAFAATDKSGQMSGQQANQRFQRGSAADAVAAANARARQAAQNYNLGNPQRDWANKLHTWGLKTGRSDKAGELGVAEAAQRGRSVGNLAVGTGEGLSALGAGSGTGYEDTTGGVGRRTYTDEYGKLHDAEE